MASAPWVMRTPPSTVDTLSFFAWSLRYCSSSPCRPVSADRLSIFFSKSLKASTAFFTPSVSPVIDASAAVAMPKYLLKPPAILPKKPPEEAEFSSVISVRTLRTSADTCWSCLLLATYSVVLRLMVFNSLLSCFSACCRSFRLVPFRFFITRVTSTVVFFTFFMDPLRSSASFFSFIQPSLSPTLKALSISAFSSLDFFFRISSSYAASVLSMNTCAVALSVRSAMLFIFSFYTFFYV